jgi:hypothetical protein
MDKGNGRELHGDFHRDASDRLTFDMAGVPADSYPAFCRGIAEKFQLRPVERGIAGLDEVFRDYGREGLVIGLEWDNWSGFTVVAKSPQAEQLVRQIAAYLATQH